MTCPRHWTLVTELKLECRIPDSLFFFSFPRVPFKFFLPAFFFVSLSSNIQFLYLRMNKSKGQVNKTLSILPSLHPRQLKRFVSLSKNVCLSTALFFCDILRYCAILNTFILSILTQAFCDLLPQLNYNAQFLLILNENVPSNSHLLVTMVLYTVFSSKLNYLKMQSRRHTIYLFST